MARTREDRLRDAEEEEIREAFYKKAEGIRNRLLSMNSSLFMVVELNELFSIPRSIHKYDVPKYSKENMKWLEELENKVNLRRSVLIDMPLRLQALVRFFLR